jgi:hypothetical protein
MAFGQSKDWLDSNLLKKLSLTAVANIVGHRPDLGFPSISRNHKLDALHSALRIHSGDCGVKISTSSRAQLGKNSI